MGDLAPHMINCARAIMGPIAELSARIETLHAHAPRPGRPGRGPTMTTHAQMMVRFASGTMGHSLFQAAPPRAARWAMPTRIPRHEKARCASIRKIRTLSISTEPRGRRRRAASRASLTGPAASGLPCLLSGGRGMGPAKPGPDRVIRGARLFFRPSPTAAPAWPSFHEGLAVAQVIETRIPVPNDTGAWQPVPARPERDPFMTIPNRQCALFMGRGIRGRSAQSAMALGPQATAPRRAIPASSWGPVGFMPEDPAILVGGRWTSTGSS